MSNYTHILVAVDFSKSADMVIDKAVEIAKRNNAKISLLHIVEFLPPIDSVGEPFVISNWEIDEDGLLERAEQSLQDLIDKHKLENAESSVQLGTPKHEISHFVKDNNCDLVVMGSHGRHGLSLLLGSTANAVLHDMPCDILTVKIDE